MLGIADSLNVSASAAVLFYEALRQKVRGSPLKVNEGVKGDRAKGGRGEGAIRLPG